MKWAGTPIIFSTSIRRANRCLWLDEAVADHLVHQFLSRFRGDTVDKALELLITKGQKAAMGWPFCSVPIRRGQGTESRLGYLDSVAVGFEREAAVQAFSEFISGTTSIPNQIEFVIEFAAGSFWGKDTGGLTLHKLNDNDFH